MILRDPNRPRFLLAAENASHLALVEAGGAPSGADCIACFDREQRLVAMHHIERSRPSGEMPRELAQA